MHVTSEKRQFYLHLMGRYIAISVFCAAVSLVYSIFSHGIHSRYMTFLFAWPLALGALPCGLAAAGFYSPADAASEGKKDLWRFGIAAVTVASLLKGVLEIAGNDSAYTDYLMAAGIVMLAAGAAACIHAAARR